MAPRLIKLNVKNVEQQSLVLKVLEKSESLYFITDFLN